MYNREPTFLRDAFLGDDCRGCTCGWEGVHMYAGVDACVEARSQGQLSSLITLQLSKSSPVG